MWSLLFEFFVVVRCGPIVLLLLLALTSPLRLEGRTAPAAPFRVSHETFSSGGRRIRVDVFAPAVSRPTPAVLVLHSAAGTLIGRGELEQLCRRLAGQGETAFLVHYFDRTGTIFAGGKAIDKFWPVWLDTVRGSVNYVAHRPGIDPKAIGIFGYSLGAYLAVAESSTDSRISAVAEVAGGIFDGFEGRMRRLPPLLILHGRADQRVPVARAFELARAARRLSAPVEIKIYEGNGHRLSPSAGQDASRRVLPFLMRHLNRS